MAITSQYFQFAFLTFIAKEISTGFDSTDKYQDKYEESGILLGIPAEDIEVGFQELSFNLSEHKKALMTLNIL